MVCDPFSFLFEGCPYMAFTWDHWLENHLKDDISHMGKVTMVKTGGLKGILINPHINLENIVPMFFSPWLVRYVMLC